MSLRIANLELHLTYPSITKGRSWASIETHRTAPDLVSSGGAFVWIGRLHAVISTGTSKRTVEGA